MHKSLPNVIAELAKSPDMYPLRLLVPHSQVEFCTMDRASYGETPFLDHRIVRTSESTSVFPFEAIEAALGKQKDQSACFVFHNAFACSTLLTRYLDALDGPLVLREPNSLYEVATLSRFGGMPMIQPLRGVSWQALYQFVTRLMARRYTPELPTIVKPTDGCNNLMPSLLDEHADNKGVFIYASFERFMTSVLRNQERHEWSRVRVRELLLDVYREKGAVPAAPESLNVWQSAAMVWFLHTERYWQYSMSASGSRCVSLDADSFVANPLEYVYGLCCHFDLGYSQEEVGVRLKNMQADAHSKAPQERYDRDQRESDFQSAYSQFAEDIAQAGEWVKQFCVSRDLDEALPNPLCV